MIAVDNLLFENQDIEYAEFSAKLNPDLNRESFIGVRTPILRKMAKELYGSDIVDNFLSELPHRYFEENQLHAFIISLEKDEGMALKRLDEFLPFVDNWATCDQLKMKIFSKNRDLALEYAYKCCESDLTYTIRFGIEMFMNFFLDDLFEPKFNEYLSGIRSDEYYINMMLAWYFATAMAKQYEDTLPILLEKKLDKWVHNKTIQKSVESNRISLETKEYLKTLKIK